MNILLTGGAGLIGMAARETLAGAGHAVTAVDITDFGRGDTMLRIVGLDDSLQPGQELTVRATAEDGTVKEFQATAKINTPVELEYYRNGGILPTVLRNQGVPRVVWSGPSGNHQNGLAE